MVKDNNNPPPPFYSTNRNHSPSSSSSPSLPGLGGPYGTNYHGSSRRWTRFGGRLHLRSFFIGGLFMFTVFILFHLGGNHIELKIAQNDISPSSSSSSLFSSYPNIDLNENENSYGLNNNDMPPMEILLEDDDNNNSIGGETVNDEMESSYWNYLWNALYWYEEEEKNNENNYNPDIEIIMDEDEIIPPEDDENVQDVIEVIPAQERDMNQDINTNIDMIMNVDVDAMSQPSVLILVSLTNSVKYLPHFFKNVIGSLDYPSHLLSFGFLVLDSTDNTLTTLRTMMDSETNEWLPEGHGEVIILERHHNYKVTRNDDRHRLATQIHYRSHMAKSRNALMRTCLQNQEYVLWLDIITEWIPSTFLQDLISVNRDIVVPTILVGPPNLSIINSISKNDKVKIFDHNTWIETKESRAIESKLEDHEILFEGYGHETGRILLGEVREYDDAPLGLLDTISIDGTGAHALLVKSYWLKEGLIFPPVPISHTIEQEGFGKMAKQMGCDVVGLPNYFIYHFG